MKLSFTPEDLHHLKAAQGWLELGDALSAFEELENLAPLARANPVVLKLRWQIYNRSGHHQAAFSVAHGLVRLLPGDAEAVIWQAYSARRMKGGGVEQALRYLLEGMAHCEPFPTHYFNAACYNCQLGRVAEARAWLKQLFTLTDAHGRTKEWKLKVLDEPDLEPLWQDASQLDLGPNSAG